MYSTSNALIPRFCTFITEVHVSADVHLYSGQRPRPSSRLFQTGVSTSVTVRNGPTPRTPPLSPVAAGAALGYQLEADQSGEEASRQHFAFDARGLQGGEGAVTTPGIARKLQLKGLTYQELEAFVVRELRDEPKRARVLWTWLYRDKYWAAHPSEMEGVSMQFRAKLAETAEFDALQMDEVRTAQDGTRKITFRLPKEEGAGLIETVLIPHTGDGRNTLCVSSQLGCAMNCQFCFTAKMGLQRQLSAGQIVDQLVQARRQFVKEVGPITNVVFMGMGEPLHNLDNVLKAVELMVDPSGLHCSPARITVSTSGIVPAIRRFCQESPASLAVSLNATTDASRDALMPINRAYDLAALLTCLREEFPRNKSQSRVFFEYIMLAGVNDSDEDARRLLELTDGIPSKINLIVFNPHDGTHFRPTPMAQVLRFRLILKNEGKRMVFIRQSRGDDEMAACGQLGHPGGKESKA